MINVAAKLFPNAVKALGKEAVLELVIGGGIVGGATNFVIDKGFEAAKTAATTYAESKKAELEQKKTALLEQTAEPTKIMEFPAEEEKVEKEDKKTSKKNK